MSTNDQEILRAVEEVRDERPDLLGEDADTLARWLATTPRDDPEAVRQTANRALALLQGHPEAMTLVKGKLGVKGDLSETLRGYEPAPGGAPYDRHPGGPEEIPAGTLMVCPKDPDHYQRRLRQKGQKLFCPDHQVALVPADSLPSQE